MTKRIGFIISYTPTGGQKIYVRQYDDERDWTYNITEASRFTSASKAAQYMMSMGPHSSYGGNRVLSAYAIEMVEIVPPNVPQEDVVFIRRV